MQITNNNDEYQTKQIKIWKLSTGKVFKNENLKLTGNKSSNGNLISKWYYFELFKGYRIKKIILFVKN